MVVEHALEELQIEGEFHDQVAANYPSVISLMEDVLDHGEVHAKWADSEGDVEVRQGSRHSISMARSLSSMMASPSMPSR